jgi:hypothetical protein
MEHPRIPSVLENGREFLVGQMVADSTMVGRDLPANAEDYVPMPAGTRFRRWAKNIPANRSSHGCV